ncbi:twin-arginine translocase TatA/TatE family subunit [Coralliovum pocilloporae]|uniref:twin-arginine translocase TatA/TatE family subunit n=1 Tax=Coralliovum pocilloporae TaxID=3066369 RepID=UPI003306E3EA
MSLGFWQIVIIAVIVVLLFGRGKISELMGDVAKGINSFKKGLAEDDTGKDPKTIDHDAAENASTSKSEDNTKAG